MTSILSNKIQYCLDYYYDNNDENYRMSETYSVERVVAATAELVATLRAAEMHTASFRQCILKAAVWTGWSVEGKKVVNGETAQLWHHIIFSLK